MKQRERGRGKRETVREEKERKLDRESKKYPAKVVMKQRERGRGKRETVRKEEKERSADRESKGYGP